MAKAGRPFLNASRLRVEAIGDEDKTISTLTGDAARAGRGGTTLESGETYIITAAKASSSRTITLPPASRGAYVRIIWGVADDAQSTIIVTSDTTNEGITGWIPYYDADDSRYIGHTTSQFTALATGTPDDGSTAAAMDTITLAANIEPGSMLSFFSDGVNWYTMGCQMMGTSDFPGASGLSST